LPSESAFPGKPIYRELALAPLFSKSATYPDQDILYIIPAQMMSYLERQTTLTGNQRRIIAAAILGDMLEFFDYFLIGYVVAFI
jgi:hypothetical protein